MRLRGVIVWLVAGVLVVLLGRAIAYAAVPGPAASLYRHEAGGPALPLLALVALTLGAAVATAVCWLAALGVRERQLLERRVIVSPPPRLRPSRVLLHAFGLLLVVSPAAGLLEATIHWRAGLGWHGLHCLVGPVHRDLLPILGALSLVAAAVVAAAEHVVAWMRRTFGLVRASTVRLSLQVPPAPPLEASVPRERLRAGEAAARAPPAAA